MSNQLQDIDKQCSTGYRDEENLNEHMKENHDRYQLYSLQ